MAEITKIQEEIKAAFSDESWNRQRQWDLKKEALFEALSALGRFHEKMQQLATATRRLQDARLTKQSTNPQLRAFMENYGEPKLDENISAYERLVGNYISEVHDLRGAWDAAHLIASVSSGKEAQEAMTTASKFFAQMAGTVVGDSLDGFDARFSRLEARKRIDAVLTAVRKELRIKSDQSIDSTIGSMH